MKDNKTLNRLTKAILRVRESSRKLWKSLMDIVRGRETPLPKSTGVMRRVLITSVGIIALLMLLLQVAPAMACGLARDLNKSFCENADIHAAEIAAKETEKCNFSNKSKTDSDGLAENSLKEVK